MVTQSLKIIRIGNSQGVRLPVALLARCRLGEVVVAEARPEGLLLRPVADERLSWEDTGRAMATEKSVSGDEFADFSETDGDGLDRLDP